MSLQTSYWVSGTASVQIMCRNGERGDVESDLKTEDDSST